MSEISNLNGSNNDTSTLFSTDAEQTSTYTESLFQRLKSQDVEQFYKSYHFWSLQRRIETLYTETSAIQQAIIDNHTLMQQIPLSAIALASLAQLQACGVSDLALLDRMLERGEAWLDHAMQLLEHCEKLDVIRGDYTQWCEHALEGAYDWIASVSATDTINQHENDMEVPALNDAQQTQLHTATEEQLLQKLMSDEEATQKITAMHSPLSETRESTLTTPTRKITQPLEQIEQTALTTPTRKITQPLDQVEQTTLTTLTRKITQPLDQADVLIETELLAEIGAATEREQTVSAKEDTNAALEVVPQEDDTAHPREIPALISETPEVDSKVDAERNLDNTSIPDTSNQIIEEPHIERFGQIDKTEHIAEVSGEVVQESTAQESTIQEIATSDADDVLKDTDIHPVEETIVSEEASDQTHTEVVAIRESPPENIKPKLQKVRRRGFWRLLNRLLAIILRR